MSPVYDMIKYRVIIAGGRDYDWRRGVHQCNMILKRLCNDDRSQVELVTGTAKGADQIPYQLTDKYWYSPPTEFPADWDKHGKAAGYLRNKEMAHHATHLIAFWDGKSKGTKHMIDLAKNCGLKVKIIKYKPIGE